MPDRRSIDPSSTFHVTGSQPAGGRQSPAGFSEPKFYDLHAARDAEEAREAEVAGQVKALQARARDGSLQPPESPPAPPPVPGAPVRCAACGYLTTARGHLAECEEAGDA